MIGHTLLSTKFNTLHYHKTSYCSGQGTCLITQRLWVQTLEEVRDCFNFKILLYNSKFQLGKNSYVIEKNDRKDNELVNHV